MPHLPWDFMNSTTSICLTSTIETLSLHELFQDVGRSLALPHQGSRSHTISPHTIFPINMFLAIAKQSLCYFGANFSTKPDNVYQQTRENILEN